MKKKSQMKICLNCCRKKTARKTENAKIHSFFISYNIETRLTGLNWSQVVDDVTEPDPALEQPARQAKTAASSAQLSWALN